MDKRMDEILHIVAREANQGLELDSFRDSICAKYRKHARMRNQMTRWAAAAAAVVVLAGVGVFANRDPMAKSAPGADERMIASENAPDTAPDTANGLAENEAFEMPEAPAQQAPEAAAEESPQALSEPCDEDDRGEAVTSRLIDAGVRSFSGSGSDIDLTPRELPAGWSVTETVDGWTASDKNGHILDCRRVDQGALIDRTEALKMKQPALGQAIFVSYDDGSMDLYYRAAEGIELCFYSQGIDEDTLLDIALSVGETAE